MYEIRNHNLSKYRTLNAVEGTGDGKLYHSYMLLKSAI